jgi:phage gp46-like protein
MGNPAIVFRRFSPNSTAADLAVENGDLKADNTFETVVYLSLYTDADAGPDDEVPEGLRPNIWWGQAYWGRVFAILGIELSGVQLGSLRWTLVRAKQTEETRLRSMEIDRKALAWMIAISLAARIDIDAEWVAPGQLLTTIAVHKPDGLIEKYQAFWKAAEQ